MTTQPHHDNTVQLVKDTADIVEVIGEFVNLKRSGANFKGLCPFHSEKTPSFMVNPDRRSFHCFGCGEGGDILTFVMKYHRLSFGEALRELAQRYHIDLPEKPFSAADQAKAKRREALYLANEKAAAVYHELLLASPAAEPARRYLAQRGIPKEVVSRFRLGFAPERWDHLQKSLAGDVDPAIAADAGLLVAKERGGYYDRFRNRVLCPIIGPTGRVVGFGGRILGDGQPKYLNSPETAIFDKSRTLFGLYQNRDAIRQSRSCLIVEGNFDLLSLVAHGIADVVAPLGTALTAHQIRTLKGYADEAILLFDGDAAGMKAAMRSVPLFLTEQITARVVILPQGHDPDTFVREQGAEVVRQWCAEAMSLPEFVFQHLVEQHGLSIEGKSKIIAALRPIVEAIGDQHLQRTVFVAHFSDKLGISAEQLLGTVPLAAATPTTRRPAPAREIDLPRNQRQLLEFLVLYPEYLAPFLEAGVDAMITSPAGRHILERLRHLAGEVGAAGPEQLLSELEGAERSFVSCLLINAPAYSDKEKEREAAEKIAWLEANSLKIERQRLTRQISEAQKNQNVTLCLELMEKKRAIEQRLATT